MIFKARRTHVYKQIHGSFQAPCRGQVEDRGSPVRDAAERLGVSTKSIYA